MKGKFITGILTVAVLLGLLLVPAMGVSVSAGPGPGTATFLMPATVKVTPGSSFAVNVTISNPNGLTLSSGGIDVFWSAPSMLGVSAVDAGEWGTWLGAGWDNSTGELYAAGAGSIAHPNTTNVSILECVVHFVAGSSEGVATVNFNPSTDNGSTLILDTLSNDVCNWTPGDMQNMTVYIGTPKLTVAEVGSGTVKANGVTLIGNPNTTNRSWDEVVSLQGVPAAGWAFDTWTGDVTGSANPSNVTMNALTKNVTANFVQLPPVLAVDPLALAFTARYGNSTDNKTVTISNTGGGTLCWAVGSPPAWTVGDWWLWYNYYGANNNTVSMNVTGADANNYAALATFTPPAARVVNVAGVGNFNVQMLNATVLVDKYTLSTVRQDANLLIFIGGNWLPANATVTWSFLGCHEWPYYLGKQWAYVVTQSLCVMGVPQPPKAPTTAYAAVTNYTNVTKATLGGVALPEKCWEIVNFLNPADPANSTFKVEYWSPTARNDVFTMDAGTYVYPPPDIQVLLGSFVQAPAPAVPPAWLSFNKTHGSLGIGGSETLLVTASSSGLNVTTYTGNFVISAPGSVQTKTVNVSLEVTPATTIDVIRDLPADALDVNAEYPGDTFNVWVNFTAPVDNFATVGLTDLAPAGWAVQTNTAWCSPAASWTKGEGNKAEYAWSGPYAKGQVFQAMYKVTIPATAANGLNTWPNNDGTKAWAEYWFGPVGPYTSNVTGDWQKIVTVPGYVVGETMDVNAAPLDTVLVVLLRNPAVVEDSDSSAFNIGIPDPLYKNLASVTGMYWQEASKYCYFILDTNAMPITRNPYYPDNIDLSTTALLYAGSTMDFEGDYGLVPKACTMSYAMKSVNHWLFVPIDGSAVPHPDWQLSNWKAMESVHSWQFPTGCNL